MAIIPHTADKNLVAAIVSEIRRASDAGILVNGDLTSAATAKANSAARIAKLAPGEKGNFAGLSDAIDKADSIVAGFTTGSSIAAIDNAVPTTDKRRGRRLRY